MEGYYLGLDLGTSGIKAGIVDQHGRIIADLYWDTELVTISPNRIEHDPDVILEQTVQIIAAVIQKAKVDPKSILGMTIDGQMGGIIGVDRSGNSITGFDMGLDIRSEAYNLQFHELIGEKVSTITFGSPRNTPKIMRWKQEHPEIYQKTCKFVTLNSYISAKLAGLSGDAAFIDYTLLAFFGNEDAHTLQWSEELTIACGLDLEKFPAIVQPWDCIGGITKEMAQKSNLPENTPIFAGCGDQPAGFLGAGFMQHGSLLDVSGSTTLLFCATDIFKPDSLHHTVMYMPSVIKDTYTAFTYVNGGGMTLKWFRDELTPHLSWKELSKQITSIPPGSDGLLFSPYFGGRQCPYNNTLRGAWVGMNWKHSKNHLFRALLEGLTYDYAMGKEQIAQLIPSVDTSIIEGIGGGAKDVVWNQMKADVMNITYHQRPSQQYAIRGCASIVGYGLGILPDFTVWAADIEKEQGRVYLPNAHAHKSYIPYFEAFKQLFDTNLSETMRVLATLS